MLLFKLMAGKLLSCQRTTLGFIEKIFLEETNFELKMNLRSLKDE